MSQSSKSVMYLMIGAVVGVGIGYLLFKEKSEVADKTKSDESDSLQNKIRSLKEKVEEKVEEGVDYVENIIDELVKECDISTPELINLLETKLKGLKAAKK